MKKGIVCLLVGFFGWAAGARAAADETFDVVVYGGTSGGVAAAVQASRMGKKAVIVEPGKHLGGMTAGGLSAVDIGDPKSVGGIAREYFTKLAGEYGKTLPWNPKPGEVFPTGGAFAINPHSAEKLFDEMVRAANVPFFFDARLASVQKNGPHLNAIVAEDGKVFRGKVFIDATYEGDLLAMAGVSYTVMREGNAKYAEAHNGIQYVEKFSPRLDYEKPGPNGRSASGHGAWDRDLPLDPYVVPGDPKSGLLPLVQAGDPGKIGDPAPGVQAYCYRLCLTTAKDRLPILPPPDYDPKRYELVARFIAACEAMGEEIDLRWFSKHDPLPNEKWDFNTATFGGNLPGASWEWPEASYSRREELARELENYHRGLLHFLATDPRVPAKVREEMKTYGLPKDEFMDTSGWPHQIYVREGRRMVSDLVMTEHHTGGREVAPDSIGLGSYGTDTHEIRRIVKDGVVTREGKTAADRGGAPPYPIGYGAIVPKIDECDNLFATFALSASHTAFSSIRMEPVLMVTSQSAAIAACIAIDDEVPVQKVDYAKFRERAIKDGQVLEWTKPSASTSKDHQESVVWKRGESGVAEQHVFALSPSPKGDILAFAEGRITRGDDSPHHLLLKRSSDGGATWSENVIVRKSENGECFANPTPVVDRSTGRIFLLHALNHEAASSQLFYCTSDDDGRTWSKPVELKGLFDDDPLKRTFHLPGPGHGIQLANGRLVVPVWHRQALFQDGKTLPVDKRDYTVSTIFSDDGGKNWRAGKYLPTGHGANESRVVELADGSLLLNVRAFGSPKAGESTRLTARSRDGGETWSEPKRGDGLAPAVECDAGFTRLAYSALKGQDWLLLSRPACPDKPRRNQSIALSRDGGKSWVERAISPFGGYSDVIELPDGSVGILFHSFVPEGFPETGAIDPKQDVNFRRVTLPWILGDAAPDSALPDTDAKPANSKPTP